MTVSASDFSDLKRSIPSIYKSNYFYKMIEFIQDEIDDTTSEYVGQIQDSILIALRTCQREKLLFNHKQEFVFTVQSEKQWYGEEDGLLILPDMLVQNLFLSMFFSEQYELFYKPIEELKEEEILQKKDNLSVLSKLPKCYTILNNKIGLFPVPKDEGIAYLSCYSPCIIDGYETRNGSVWLSNVFDLIKARAKYELYKNILKDPEDAAVSYNDFQEQLKLLHCESSRLRGCENIRPTGF